MLPFNKNTYSTPILTPTLSTTILTNCIKIDHIHLLNMIITKCDILKLYKNCLIYVNSLKYSDKTYLKSRLRQEFRRKIEPNDLDYYYKKGLTMIQRDRLG